MLNAMVILASVSLPPERFDRPAKGVTIIELPRREVERACRGHFGWLAQGLHGIQGCADPVARLVIVPQNDECVLRHEMGHINGWSADHRGGRELAEC